MNRDVIARYEGQRIPRYTSYPTAPHFGTAVDSDTYSRWLEETAPDTRLSLYLHVPFCRSMCWYCGCHTTIVQHDEPILSYVEALEREIDLVADRLPEPMAVGHLHWGGGTPTILSPDAFQSVMRRLRRRFAVAAAAEVAVEIDPRRVTSSVIDAMAESGVNRASLGVQSFDPVVQKAVNRIQTFEQTGDVTRSLRAAGVRSVNFDLIYGLPHQTVESCRDTVAQALTLSPDRVSVFGYAHVPWMKRHQKRIDEQALPDGQERLAQFQTITESLVDAGYVAVGLDHFARPDDSLAQSLADGGLRRNFQGYTVDGCDALIGFGASAIGFLQQGYVQNDVGVGAYGRILSGNRFATARGLALTPDDRLRREVIERIMCYGAVDLEAVASRHGATAVIFDDAFDALRGLQADGVIAIDGARIAVEPTCRALVRSVAAAFDAYLRTDATRHSKAI